MTPYAYIRRSVSRAGDRGDISREYQIDEVRKLANGDGATLRIIDGDWGRSAGRKSAHLRAAFLAMLADIEAGRVSTLYAYAEDRLARDVEASVRLLNACERTRVPIVTRADRYEPGDPRARRRFIDEANDNEYALSKMAEKATDTATKRKERGDHMGRAPYGYRHAMIDGKSTLVPREGESISTVLEAFKATGTYNEAAKLLSAPKGAEVRADDGHVIGTGFGLPTRFGVKWEPSTVRHIVRREAPELVPPVTHRGSATAKGAQRFARLLRCPHYELHPQRPFLTSGTSPTYNAKDGTERTYAPRYYCAVAHSDATHPRPYIVAESKVLDWAKREIAMLPNRLQWEAMSDRPGAEAQMAALVERRARVLQMFEDGDIDRAEKARRIALIDAEVPALEQKHRAVARWTGKVLPPIDWDAPPAEVNAELRRLWQWVDLDPATMEPVRAQWIIGQDPDTQNAPDAGPTTDAEARATLTVDQYDEWARANPERASH